MRGPLLVITLVLVLGSSAAARPPLGRPFIVSGDVVLGAVGSGAATQPSTSVYRYDARWSDDVTGYIFLAPYRPEGWDVITVDAEGVASCGVATADWSQTPVSNPLVVDGFAFIPTEIDMGTGWDLEATREPLLWGFALGFAIDLLCMTYRISFGALWHSAGRMGAGRSAF